MTVASSFFQSIELKRETAFGVPDTDTDSAELLSRVEFAPKTDQQVQKSNEIRGSMQQKNYARGIKSATATLKTECKAGAYKTLWAALLRQAFNTGVVADITATDISANAQVANLTTTGSDWTASTSLHAEAGDTVIFTGFTGGNKANNGKEWIVLAAASGSLKLRAKNGNFVMLADSAGESVTVTNLGTDDVPKNKVITRTTIAAVADDPIFETVGEDFTSVFARGNNIKVDGFTGGNVGNNNKPFHITKLTATEIYGYYIDGSLSANDAATESVTVTKDDNVKMTYSSANALQVATTTRLTSNTSFIAEGFKIHDVIRLVGFPTSTNNNRNLLIKSFGSNGTQLNFVVLDDDATTVPMVVESAGSGDYVYRVGKKAFIPQSEHTNHSFMIEEWQSDITQSRRYTGQRLSMAKVTAPNSGIPTVDFDFVGKDRETAQTHYYTSSAEPIESQNLDTIFGRVYIDNGTSPGCVTSFDLTINANMMALDKCIGSDTAADVVQDKPFDISGQMTVYFEDEANCARFEEKTEMSIVFILKESNAYSSDFIAFQMPRVIYSSMSTSAGSKTLETYQIMAFENPTGDDGNDKSKLKSSFSIQDSLA